MQERRILSMYYSAYPELVDGSLVERAPVVLAWALLL